ncbi:MAG: hypothetical protein VX346_06370 [Planctomycetota bacterium]|nr:hypothetical protein [Planctomycetota bacterium]
MSQQYFIRRGTKVSGPAQADLLQQYAASGKLRPTDEVSTSREGPWHAVQQVPLLARHLAASDPPEDPFADALAAASTLSEAAPAMPQSAAPQRKKKRKPQRKKKARPQGQKKTGQRPSWLEPAVIGGGLLCLLALVGYAFLGTGSGNDAAFGRFIAGAFLMTIVLVYVPYSTLIGGFSLALALCLLNASRSTFADFFTHFKSGLIYYATLWGAGGIALLVSVLSIALLPPFLSPYVAGLSFGIVWVLSYRLLMDRYDWEVWTVRLVWFVMNVIQGLAVFVIQVVIGFLAA